jgi:hypothetical protein
MLLMSQNYIMKILAMTTTSTVANDTHILFTSTNSDQQFKNVVQLFSVS